MAVHVLIAVAPVADSRAAGDPLDGELVVLPLPDVDLGDVGLFRENPRTFVGIDSQANITTVEVVELDVSPHDAMAHVVESLARHGPWGDQVLTSTAAQLTAEMLSVARQFPVGTVMVKDGPVLHAHVPVVSDGRRPVCDPGRERGPSG